MITRILQHMLRVLVVACILVVVVVICIGVFFRYFLDSPLSWTDEISRYALVWMTFLGGALLTSYREGHVNVDFFVNLAGPRSQAFALLIATVLEIGVVMLLTAGGILLILASPNVTSPALAIPMVYVYGVIPAFGLMSLWFIGVRLVAQRRPG